MKKNIQTSEEIWKFIESILVPHKLMLKKTDLTDEQVTKLYSELVSVDLMLRELEQILILKKA